DHRGLCLTADVDAAHVHIRVDTVAVHVFEAAGRHHHGGQQHQQDDDRVHMPASGLAQGPRLLRAQGRTLRQRHGGRPIFVGRAIVVSHGGPPDSLSYRALGALTVVYSALWACCPLGITIPPPRQTSCPARNASVRPRFVSARAQDAPWVRNAGPRASRYYTDGEAT